MSLGFGDKLQAPINLSYLTQTSFLCFTSLHMLPPFKGETIFSKMSLFSIVLLEIQAHSCYRVLFSSKARTIQWPLSRLWSFFYLPFFFFQFKQFS